MRCYECNNNPCRCNGDPCSIENCEIVQRLNKLENALRIISGEKPEWDNATPEMGRDGMRLIARIALEA